MPPKFWAYAGIVLAVTLILNWKWSQGQIESSRQKLMAKQRAVLVELGPRWTELRDRVERWTSELAREAGPDVIDREALKGWDFRQMPGVYLRLRTDQVGTAEDIRKGAVGSLRDAFTACLLRANNQNPLAGKECQRTRDCAQGEYCNENDHCSRPVQPFNLRIAYRTLRVLSDEFVRDVQGSNELGLRALDGTFEDIMRDDMPLATELLTRAQYYLVVLDEPAEGAKVQSTEDLLATPHHARIGVWRLSDGKLVLRLRREASADLRGGMPVVDADVMAAQQRQANSCALALSVRQAMGDASAAAVAPE
ncbi:hypothetical protein [Chondromyces apiculatus]|uniref:Uncharacterized protein n=1 Tax=Chondromyces apiculatus DSM 436 TaxID=1192034 RepID=A0A017SUR8_9BACT|nr:hypothetical protein [Chondromyces apiculatus]EYF00714.1 Hypothetical protein CAP_0346 [Chondromyces apiculatus DSM 436]